MKTQFNPTFRNSQKAFEDAIRTDTLSDNPESDNYAGKFMYMYSHSGYDYFKNKMTREYIHSLDCSFLER